MTKYTPDWELESIPDEPLYSEVGRRRRALRKASPPKPPKLAPCVHCQAMLTVRQRRSACPQCGKYQKRDKS